MKSHSQIYAVILNYNGYDDTVSCIESFKKTNYNYINITIVDNASTDGSGRLLFKKYPDLHFIFSPKNKGYAGGMNLGIEYALQMDADFVLLVNNDIVVSENFLDPMMEDMADKSVGIVSGKVFYKEYPDTIYCAGGRVDFLKCTGVAEFQGKNSKNFANEKREITLAEGCFMLVRKEVFERVGILEEKFFMYLEDLDFSLRVGRHFKIVYNNNSIIYHKSGGGKGWDEYTPLYSYYYTRNRLWFFCNYFILYRLYVIFFSVLVSILKSLKMFQSFIMNPGKRLNLKKSFISLWKGTIDGILLILRIKKSKKTSLSNKNYI